MLGDYLVAADDDGERHKVQAELYLRALGGAMRDPSQRDKMRAAKTVADAVVGLTGKLAGKDSSASDDILVTNYSQARDVMSKLPRLQIFGIECVPEANRVKGIKKVADVEGFGFAALQVQAVGSSSPLSQEARLLRGNDVSDIVNAWVGEYPEGDAHLAPPIIVSPAMRIFMTASENLIKAFDRGRGRWRQAGPVCPSGSRRGTRARGGGPSRAQLPRIRGARWQRVATTGGPATGGQRVAIAAPVPRGPADAAAVGQRGAVPAPALTIPAAHPSGPTGAADSGKQAPGARTPSRQPQVAIPGAYPPQGCATCGRYPIPTV